jgi:O-Antigen ligase
MANRARLSWTDRYGVLLMGFLAAQAIGGKGFAYIGVPPLFVTELVLGLGLAVMLNTRCVIASMLTVPSLCLTALIILSIARTAPFVPAYGVDALRDSVLVLYALFGFIAATLLLQRPDRLIGTVAFLRWFTGIFVYLGPAVFLFSAFMMPQLPALLTNSPGLPTIRAGELGVHLSGCALMALLGLRPARPVWLCALILGILTVTSQNRGGMLAIMVPVALALPFSRAWPRVVTMGMAGVALLGLAYAADLQVPSLSGTEKPFAGERQLDARQVVDNVLSLVIPTDDAQLDDTKMFRQMWWRKIYGYTFEGPYFWTGKGFGVNLAVDDGFVVGDPNAPPLRSPHNSHMNVLARTGVPGFALWITFMITWFGTMTGWASRAWRRGDTEWGNLMFFVACYWLANVINASFDVALEGPMLASWFWCQTGFGLGIVAIYRAAVAASTPNRRAVISDRPSIATA